MVSCVFRTAVYWGGRGGATEVGRAVGESYELGEGVWGLGTMEKGCVTCLLGLAGYVKRYACARKGLRWEGHSEGCQYTIGRAGGDVDADKYFEVIRASSYTGVWQNHIKL